MNDFRGTQADQGGDRPAEESAAPGIGMRQGVVLSLEIAIPEWLAKTCADELIEEAEKTLALTVDMVAERNDQKRLALVSK